MTEIWNQLEGEKLDSTYVLGQWLGGTGDSAAYLTQSGAQKAAVKLIKASAPGASEQLAHWRLAAGLSHPHLVRIFATGETTLAGNPFFYAVSEHSDEVLSQVLRERPLTVDETRTLLENIVDALSFLHRKNLVHGQVRPSNILAIDEVIKLTCDDIEPAGQTQARERGPYDAPERAAGSIIPASDFWSVGITLVEVLAQRRPAPAAVAAGSALNIPPPFEEIARNCLRSDATARWDGREIQATLAGRPMPAQRTQAMAAGRAEPASPPRPQQVRSDDEDDDAEPATFPWQYAAIAAVVAIGLTAVVFMTRSSPNSDAKAAAPPVVRQTPPPPITDPKPSPFTGSDSNTVPTPPKKAEKRASSQVADDHRPPSRASVSSGSEASDSQSGWRVVVWTYGSAADAERKAREIQGKWPRFHASVLPPAGRRSHYLVTLGGEMTARQAEHLQHQARAAGLPKDTYIQRFDR
jgi:serine/threonine protein kinase